MPRNSKPRRSNQASKPWSDRSARVAGGSRDRKRRGKHDGKEYRLSVRGELRKEPDVSKIARVVVALAQAQAEADARAQQESSSESDRLVETADD